MTETVSAPATVPAAPPKPPASTTVLPSQVQCSFCGRTQEFDPSYTLCGNCGQALSPDDSRIVANPRKGKGMQGLGILFFILFMGTFFFYSHFIGWNGMAISALFALWGFYRGYRNRQEPLKNE